jgi:transposase
MDMRKTVEGIAWRYRTGAPWRDIPERFGKWNSIYQRFSGWSADGTWERLLTALQAGSDRDEDEWVVSVDSTVVRAHHHAAGAPKAAPIDVAAERLAVALQDSGVTSAAGPTGG